MEGPEHQQRVAPGDIRDIASKAVLLLSNIYFYMSGRGRVLLFDELRDDINRLFFRQHILWMNALWLLYFMIHQLKWSFTILITGLTVT